MLLHSTENENYEKFWTESGICFQILGLAHGDIQTKKWWNILVGVWGVTKQLMMNVYLNKFMKKIIVIIPFETFGKNRNLVAHGTKLVKFGPTINAKLKDSHTLVLWLF